MELKYNGERVVVGSHTRSESTFQIANHYNMVSDRLSELRRYIRANMDYDSNLDRIIDNIDAQFHNTGFEIGRVIDEIEFIR